MQRNYNNRNLKFVSFVKLRMMMTHITAWTQPKW